MTYNLLKSIHLLAVVVTLFLFLLRNAWRLTNSGMLDRKWVKIAPHINDTLLLGSAIGMLIVARMNPFEDNWIMAKIIALLAYIVLGALAIKRGRTPLQQNLAFIGALALFAYMIAVAVSKQAWPL